MFPTPTAVMITVSAPIQSACPTVRPTVETRSQFVSVRSTSSASPAGRGRLGREQIRHEPCRAFTRAPVPRAGHGSAGRRSRAGSPRATAARRAGRATPRSPPAGSGAGRGTGPSRRPSSRGRRGAPSRSGRRAGSPRPSPRCAGRSRRARRWITNASPRGRAGQRTWSCDIHPEREVDDLVLADERLMQRRPPDQRAGEPRRIADLVAAVGGLRVDPGPRWASASPGCEVDWSR